MRPWSVVVVAFLLAGLAGCSDKGPSGSPPELKQAEAAAADLDVQATATTGVIRGVVVDGALHPLAKARVILSGGSNTSTTEQGAFGFDGLEAGTYFLTAALDGYTTVQQSADVVAGVDDPQAIRILLQAVPRATPFVETLSSKIFVSGSGWVKGVGGVTAGGLGVLDGNYFFSIKVTPNGTLAQTEFVWAETTPLGKDAMVSGGTYGGDDDVDTNSFDGPSPIIAKANATEGSDTADEVSYSFWGWPSDPVPVGFHVNQSVDIFVNVFHNFLPRDGWTFTGDGAYPPPA